MHQAVTHTDDLGPGNLWMVLFEPYNPIIYQKVLPVQDKFRR